MKDKQLYPFFDMVSSCPCPPYTAPSQLCPALILSHQACAPLRMVCLKGSLAPCGPFCQRHTLPGVLGSMQGVLQSTPELQTTNVLTCVCDSVPAGLPGVKLSRPPQYALEKHLVQAGTALLPICMSCCLLDCSVHACKHLLNSTAGYRMAHRLPQLRQGRVVSQACMLQQAAHCSSGACHMPWLDPTFLFLGLTPCTTSMVAIRAIPAGYL